MRTFRRTLLLFVTLATFVVCARAQEQTEELENIPAVVTGVRANVIDGGVFCVREDGKVEIEREFEFKLGDVVRTAANGRAELMLQPGNLLRVGPDTEFQIVDDRYDRLKFLLNKGSLSFELLKNDWEDTSDFFESLKQGFELMRILTPGSEVFLTQPGVFRINVTTDAGTELIVRRGEALINGRRVKEKRIASATRGSLNITETDVKNEDAFDTWARERSGKLIEANHSLKKDSPWVKKKEGREAMVDLPSEQKGVSPYVVSARPGAVNFVEMGVEFSASQKPWDTLTEKTQLSAGDKVRTSSHNFVELMMFPDLYLRLDGGSEVALEQLSNELIAVKVLRGSAILDVARFDRKELPDIAISGPATTAFVAEDGNYRINARLSGDEIMVRKGKVIYQDRSIGGCRIISGANTSECDRKIVDNFDVWSQHRGEGQFFNGTAMATRLAQLRRRRFKSTGFWYQHPQQSQYTFVPFFSTYFRSPYGGNYSCVLSPRRAPMFQFDPGRVRGPFRGAPRPLLAPYRP